MKHRTGWFARRLFAALRCCVALSAGAPLAAGAQPLACSTGAAVAGGLYGSGSGLLAGLSLGSRGVGSGGFVADASAAAGGEGTPASCAPAEAASIAVEGPSTLAGNPVDVVTGTKLDRAIDAYLPSPSRDSLDDAAELVFSRFYASDSPGSGALGPGWRMGLDVRLHASVAGGRRLLQIVQGDGRRVSFRSPRAAGDGVVRHPALSHEDGVLEQRTGELGAADARWVWHWRNGRALFFDDDGRLRRVVSRAGSPLALDYDPRGRLSAVRTASGKGVFLRYHDTNGAPGSEAHRGPHAGRLASLNEPGGRIVRYDYDRAGRLAQVSFADGSRVGYEYADAGSHRLAAVVLPDGRRSEYRYRSDGRVIYSRAAGDGDAQALHLDYSAFASDAAVSRASGQTTLRIGDAVRASYRWVRSRSGSPARLVSSAGPGCARCPVTGRQYRYDAAGRLVAVTAAAPGGSGVARSTLTILRDAVGRPVELQAGSGADQRVRIVWRDDALLDALRDVDRPSVVSGLRSRLRPLRDSHGRTVGIEESGYAPALDAEGRSAPAAAIHLRRVSTSLTAAMLLPSIAATPMPGGAHTSIWRDDFGRAVGLRSPDFGLVRRHFDEHDRLQLEQRADGSAAHYRYDGEGRLVEYRETSAAGSGSGSGSGSASGSAAESVARLRWSQDRLAEIGNENQREWLTTDAGARVVGRRIALRLESGRAVEFDMRFEYDDTGRLSAWSLPGGGWIRARADPRGQTIALDWQPAEATWSLPLVSGLERDRHGLRRAVFGNGIVATTRRTADGGLGEIRHRSTRGIGRRQDVLHHRFVFDADGRLVAWRRGAHLRANLYDGEGRLLQASQRSRSDVRVWRIAYDANGNRVLAQRGATGAQRLAEPSTERFETVGRGNRLRRVSPARSAPGKTSVRAEGANHDAAVWDSAGRLISDAGRSYDWDAGGRLREVREAGRTIASYRYDARGQRVAKLVDGVATHYLYDAQRRLLAELDAQGGVLRQYVYLADRPIAVLDRVDAPKTGVVTGTERTTRRIRYLHLNHLGAPEAVTDERARVIWRAEYAPFGRRLRNMSEAAPHRAQPAFELALRLPGQYEDPETGLHYNDHRYYDPDTGRYLSPDPLGLAGGPNPYVYAGNDPLTRIDPSGLLLFAFDGTDNGDPPARHDDWSNVYKLSRTYSDGRVWYMAGVGRDDAASGIRTNGVDAVNANTARARVDYLLSELDLAVSAPASRGVPVDVDVIGFSRGAAMARDFSSRVAERIRSGAFGRIGACVRLRFLGLWDTVAQFGAAGIGNAGWRLAVPAEAAYAAQAVALNEHRTLFPAESIVGSPLAGVRIERGFIGAHSDIGGSYAEGDLSDVALIWMHEQARLAGVRMFALTSEFARVTAPLLHDSNTGGIGDREFRYRNSWGWTFARPMQRVARVDGMQWSDTARFIRRLATPRDDAYGEPTIVGSVDMQGYSAWLASNYAITVGWTP